MSVDARRPGALRAAVLLDAGRRLFLFRRTLLPGVALLLGVPAWALGFHFALAEGTRILWIDLAVVVLFAAAGLVRRNPAGA